MEKKTLVRDYMFNGLSRDNCLKIASLTKNQFYYKPKGTKPGRTATLVTKWRDPKSLEIHEKTNEEVVKKIVSIKLDPDHSNWYRMVGATLQVMGYYINHKKVYRLMQSYLLLELARKRTGRDFVKYRRVAPLKPLQILEMDIKYFWVYGTNKYAFVLTIIDTFTRFVLHWSVGFSMKSGQVKNAWEYVIANYLQELRLTDGKLDIEIRNDNGKQFNANLIIDFFKENGLNQVFTHPYTPEENGHIESFHAILGKALKNDKFDNLNQLETRLAKFYATYNNDRSHGSLKGVAPSKFWRLFELDNIDIKQLKKRELKYSLKVPLQDVLLLDNINKYDFDYKLSKAH